MHNQTANIKVDTKLSKEVKSTTWCKAKMCIGRNHLESTGGNNCGSKDKWNTHY